MGESVEVVHEDGTKTPAPDGEHEIALKDSEGKEVVIRIVTKDGKITERENVEEAKPESEVEMADEKVEEIPQQIQKDKVNEVEDAPNSVKSGTLKMEEETEEVAPLTEDTDKPEDEMPTEEVDMAKQMESLSYRIEEMEAKIAKMEAMYPPVDSEVTDEVAGIKMSSEEDEEELPKLDGAPIEEGVKFSAEQTKRTYGKTAKDSQSSFLSKLYK